MERLLHGRRATKPYQACPDWWPEEGVPAKCFPASPAGFLLFRRVRGSGARPGRERRRWGSELGWRGGRWLARRRQLAAGSFRQWEEEKLGWEEKRERREKKEEKGRREEKGKGLGLGCHPRPNSTKKPTSKILLFYYLQTLPINS